MMNHHQKRLNNDSINPDNGNKNSETIYRLRLLTFDKILKGKKKIIYFAHFIKNKRFLIYIINIHKTRQFDVI